MRTIQHPTSRAGEISPPRSAYRRYRRVGLIAVGLPLSLTITAVIVFYASSAHSDSRLKQLLLMMNEIIAMVDAHYMEPRDAQQLGDAVVKAVFSKLDPHSYYLTPEAVGGRNRRYEGGEEGTLGFDFHIESDTPIVCALDNVSPARMAGILPGDRIVELGGYNVVRMSEDSIRQIMVCFKDQQVPITVIRLSTMKILRKRMDVALVDPRSYPSYCMVTATTGYLHFADFNSSTHREVMHALQELKQKGMSQLILDLRNNNGGYLESALSIADEFIGASGVMLTLRGRSGDSVVHRSTPGGSFADLPLVVLINRHSASAAEVLCGILQDFDRAYVLGWGSYGKGLVQRSYSLSNGGAIVLTTSRYYLPSGRWIQRPYDETGYLDEATVRRWSEPFTSPLDTSYIYSRPFLTRHGRVVYDKEGITPDSLMADDLLGKAKTELWYSGLFWELCRKELECASTVLASLRMEQLLEYKPKIDVIKLAQRLVKKDSIDVSNSEIEELKPWINATFRIDLAFRLHASRAFTSAALQNDNVAQTAIGCFNTARQMAFAQ